MNEMTSTASVPLFIADHLAIDFLNARYGVGTASRECFVNDRAVLDWLKSAGVVPASTQEAPQGLCALALELRAGAQALIDGAKAGACAPTTLVKQILEQGRRSRALEWDQAAARFTLVEKPRGTDAASLLEPVAAALADLLAAGSLDRVKQCEGDGCSLLFCDLTKSHRRRWCSMAVCGNRMKVAAFRARKKG